jgi:periplasmic divalent cation tolerance protein
MSFFITMRGRIQRGRSKRKCATLAAGGRAMNENQDTDFGMAFVSAPVDKAEEMARRIVEEKLAACAQVLAPMTSTYWWKGVMETEPERLIILKTRRALIADLESLLRRIHPYEVPELTFVPVSAGAASYLAWMREVLGG